MWNSMRGKNIAVLATDGVEQMHLVWPWEAMLDAGAKVELVSPQRDGVRGFDNRDPGFVFPVDKPLHEATAQDYDALLLPGGIHCPETLAADASAIQFLRDFHACSKPVAAICQAPSLLARADLVRQRRLTSWPRVRPLIRRAGGIWMDQDVVIDGGIITCRTSENLDAVCDALIATLRICDRRTSGHPMISSDTMRLT